VPTGSTGTFAEYPGGSRIIGDVNPTLRAGLVPGIYNAWLSVGTPGIVKGVRVHIAKLTHPDVGQLKVNLFGPGDTPAGTTLIDHAGNPGDSFQNLDLVQGAGALSVPFTGPFQPVGDLGVFTNLRQDGQWHLSITADNPTLLGHLDGWSLQIARAECSPLSFADLKAPAQAQPGDVELNASGSRTTAPGGITKYEWDFGSGSFTQSTTTDRVTHTFARNRYTVRVRVSDSRGVIGIDSKQLIVSRAPVAVIAPLSVDPKQGVNVVLDGSQSSDPDNAGLTKYEWDLAFDGTNFTPDATGATPTVQFPTAGAQTIALRVTDADGATAIASLPINVQAASPPAAVATATPNPAMVGDLVTFDASLSSDSDGNVVSYDWDLDANGSFETAGAAAARSYPNAGVVNVGLRVRDNDGKSSITHVAVLVRATGGDSGGGSAPESTGGAPGAGRGGATGGAGGAGAGGGPAGEPAQGEFAASLAGPSIQKLKLVTKKGLGLRCSVDRAAKCSVTVTLKAADARRLKLSKSRTKAFVLGGASVRLEQAGAATITVRLARSARTKLAKARRVSVLVTGRAVDGGGGRAVLRRVVLLRR
jgi:PKD repeat protein